MSRSAPPPRTPAVARVLTQLGGMPVREFLARYWQRRPLVIRRALPGFDSPFTAEMLFELSMRDEVESRLIDRARGRWRLRHGPLRRAAIPSRKRPGWTLLVQGVDLHLQQGADLLARFRFLPDARLDDLMVSYASDGGGVGPHVDSYDVLLLQAYGRRRWRIQRRPDPSCVPGLPIRQLARFSSQREWVLEPGDLLYLPPGVAHDGVALGESITCSIGFRTPSWADLAAACNELQQEEDGGDSNDSRLALRDAGIAPSSHPARLPLRMVEQAVRALQRRRPTRVQIEQAMLRQASEPNPRVVFEPPARAMALARFAEALRLRGASSDRRTRMLYSDRTLAINGELVPLLGAEQRRVLKSLADRRQVPAPELQQKLPVTALSLLHKWYSAGWIHLQ